MKFRSINPFNGEVVGTYDALSLQELDKKLSMSQHAFHAWRKLSLTKRCELIKKAAQILRDRQDQYAHMITIEMGKPIIEARAEVKKCAWVCDYYAENAPEFLSLVNIDSDAAVSFVRNDPMGTILGIMPWNFPFWQVFRFVAPTITAGNTVLLKHAPNVFGCAQLIEEIFTEAGYPPHVFQNLIMHHDQTERVIAHEGVQAVTLTGSERAGKAVAQLAGKNLKKTVLELGGNNAFIVCNDADLEMAVDIGIKARMMNSGQSCIAAKRFILMQDIYEEFVSRFVQECNHLKAGDPMEESTQIGPLARQDLAEQLNEQVRKSIDRGAVLECGGTLEGCFHEPTVLGGVRPGMPAFDEETFGPLAAMISAENWDEALDLARKSKFGLGVTVCTNDVKKAVDQAERIPDGAYFINELVKSDPRLPFGGTKNSGYGRELARDGMLEFVNRKTVYVN